MGVVVGEEALYPPAVGLLGLFDAQVGSGSAVQRTVPQPQGQGVDEKQREVVRLSWVREVCCFVGLLDVTVHMDQCPIPR